MTLVAQLRTRPRLISACVFGVALGALLPAALATTERALLGWNAGVWLYLLLVWINMTRLDQGRLRSVATAQADGAGIVLALAILGTLASLAAVVLELAATKAGQSHLGGLSIALVVATLVGTWLLLPMEFALSYASRYFADPAGGLEFPLPASHAGRSHQPNYADFVYFAVTIAATAQTSDVAVTTREMRRFVTLHSVLSFAFNAFVLALAINMVAGLF